MALTSLHGKRVIVTGGGSGINNELTKYMYEQGCEILIADISIHPNASEWVQKVTSGEKPTVAFLKVDVTDWAALEGMFDTFVTTFGGEPDIVVLGAGVYEASTAGFWNDADEASHYNLLDINLTHPIKATRIAIRRLRRAQKPGVILHLSSIAAQKPSVVLPLYSVSKQAISQFVRCMAPLDSMCGIKVAAISPGVVDTPLFRDSKCAMAHVNMDKDFVLPTSEIVKAMIALILEPKYPGGTVLEVGDIGNWRPVGLLNDVGPQGRSTQVKAKPQNTIYLVEEQLKKDEQS